MPMYIGIVGLGTIGGSFAKAIKAYSEHTVYGADSNEEAVGYATFSGTIDGVLNEKNVGVCDLLLLALYPQAAADYLERVSPLLKKGGVVMDCCGVKRAIFDRCHSLAKQNGFTFIGGHPMAGAVASGFQASREKMFKGASMILVRDSADTEKALPDGLTDLFLEIGFNRLIVATPEEHDRMIAFTSQLPHIISNAYVKSPSAQKHRGFSAGSFRDMARVADLNVPMWTELFLENADFLAEELDILIEHLTAYQKALREHDEQALRDCLLEGVECKNAADASAVQ